MHTAIQVRREGRRGCGWRQPGGLYLVSGGQPAPCCKLPRELSVCPTCGAGIRPARGWTWIDAAGLFGAVGCTDPHGLENECPLQHPRDMGRAGLLWIGEQFYPTPEVFEKEAGLLGVSRRIAAIPRGFVVGETWVLLAHRRACLSRAMPFKDTPGIFMVWRPTHIEKVVSPDTPEVEIDELVKRRITPVVIERLEDQEPAREEA